MEHLLLREPLCAILEMQHFLGYDIITVNVFLIFLCDHTAGSSWIPILKQPFFTSVRYPLFSPSSPSSSLHYRLRLLFSPGEKTLLSRRQPPLPIAFQLFMAEGSCGVFKERTLDNQELFQQ